MTIHKDYKDVTHPSYRMKRGKGTQVADASPVQTMIPDNVGINYIPGSGLSTITKHGLTITDYPSRFGTRSRGANNNKVA